MKTRIVIIIFLLPLFVVGQSETKLNKRIEVMAGYANYSGNINGVFMNTTFARDIIKHVELLGELSMSQGCKSFNDKPFQKQFFSSMANVGLRGSLDFLKYHSLKLACTGGISSLSVTDYINNTSITSLSWIKPNISYSLTYGVAVCDKVQLCAKYSETIIFNPSNSKISSVGMGVAFNF